MKKILKIVLPVYNEEKSILPLSIELKKLEKKLSKKYFVYFVWVNDGSTDDSLKMINKVSFKNDIVVNFIANYGKTCAILAGINEIKKFDLLAILDTDLQDNPKYIESMLNKIEHNEADLVVGNRVNRYKKNIYKLFTTSIVRHIVRSFFPKLNINDINCGIKVMTEQVAKSIYLKSDYHRYIPIIAHLKGFRVKETLVSQRNRHFGVSKYGKTGLRRAWKSFSDLLSIIFIFKVATNPFSFFGKLGIFSFLIGFSVLTYLSFLWFFGTPIDSRPLFFLGILTVISGLNFVTIGLIGDLVKMNNTDIPYQIKKK